MVVNVLLVEERSCAEVETKRGVGMWRLADWLVGAGIDTS